MPILTFLKFNIKPVLVSAAILASVFVSYALATKHADNKWNAVVAAKDAKIVALESAHNAAKQQAAELSGELVVAKQNTAKLTTQAKGLQKKVDELIEFYGYHPNPVDVEGSTTVPVTPLEELEALRTSNTKMKSDIVLFIQEIQLDRKIIDSKTVEIDILTKRCGVLESDIKILESLNATQVDLLQQVQAKLNTETKSKVAWRSNAITADSIIFIALLILLL